MRHQAIVCFGFFVVLNLGVGGISLGRLRAQGQTLQPAAPQVSSEKGNQEDSSRPSSVQTTPDQSRAAGSSLSGQAVNALPAPTAMALESSADYRIGPEDVLNISVFNVPELAQTVRVANDGTIPVLLLGPVQTAGLTAEQLQQKLQRLYGKTYLQHPVVSVYVSQFNAQPVSVIGAVARPGMYQLTGKRTLIEMLSLAGGLGSRATSVAAGRTVFITRKSGFANLPMADGMKLVAPDELQIDLHRLLYSSESQLNIPIKPKDIISVSRAAVVYVTGRGVMKPGGFVLGDRSDLTVLQAIAMAEGLSSTAAAKYTRIIHTRRDGSHTYIPVNLNKVIRGKAADPVLEANDILWVPSSREKAALKQGAEAAIGTISGLLIYGRL